MLLVGLCGCGAPDEPVEIPGGEPRPDPETFSAPASVAGDLHLDHGVVRFRPCGTDDAQPLEDATDGEARRIVEELGAGYRGVWAAVIMEEGRLVAVRTAVPEAVGCESLLVDAHAEARGNEPFWNVRVVDGEARWRTPEEMDGLRYHDGRWDSIADGRWRFEATRSGVDGIETLRLEMIEERCVDTMSGARFPYSARVEQGGRNWHGCAVEGTRATGGT